MLPSPAGEKSNNVCFPIIKSKAACWICLFLLLYSPLPAQDLAFDQTLLRAYHHALNLDPSSALETLPAQSTVSDIYIASLAETIELLITEDPAKFSEYEDRFLKRLDRNLKATPRDFQFLQAEMRLQWAFVYLKFGHELDAALQLRQAYQIAETCRNKFPEYLPIRKTSGLLQIMVGAVPDKYNWVLNLLNMNGSVSGGLAQLKEVSDSKSPLAFEGKMLHALVQGFILGKPGEGLEEMQLILDEHKGNRLALFLAASLALKNSANEIALQRLAELSEINGGIPLYYADYLRGEARLHKGDYATAASSYRWFIQHQTGENYIKDAHYKIGLCYLLNGGENDAHEEFKLARIKGKEATEADKSAGRSLAEADLPNVKLLKARYLTDGGYNIEAKSVLATIIPRDLKSPKDKIEFTYRKARLAHEMNSPDAIALYLETVKMTGQDGSYFAPNACLQLGYIYQSQNKITEAEEYFRRALAYRRHAYKNSIDTKARSALAQLGRI